MVVVKLSQHLLAGGFGVFAEGWVGGEGCLLGLGGGGLWGWGRGVVGGFGRGGGRWDMGVGEGGGGAGVCVCVGGGAGEGGRGGEKHAPVIPVTHTPLGRKKDVGGRERRWNECV